MRLRLNLHKNLDNDVGVISGGGGVVICCGGHGTALSCVDRGQLLTEESGGVRTKNTFPLYNRRQ